MAKAKATDRPSGTQPRAQERPPRVPLTGEVDILTVGKKDPNHEYRWVRDIPGRIQMFERAWWDKVTRKDVELALGANDVSTGDSSPVTMQKGTNADGTPTTLYLMRLAKKYYKESQKVKQDRIDAQEQSSMRAGEGQYGEVKQSISRSK